MNLFGIQKLSHDSEDNNTPMNNKVENSYYNRYNRLLCIFIGIFISSACFAKATDLYPLDTVKQEAQFQQLVQETRCLVCQNQNLADSNATLAKDLRRIIYEKIKKGESAQTIKKYLVNRYGEYILFKPTFSPTTYVLWLGPFILLLAIIFRVSCISFVQKSRMNSKIFESL